MAIEYIDGRGMVVVVRNRTGDECQFEVSNFTTVYALKKLYCERYFKTSDKDTLRDTYLIFNGIKLQNGETLTYYGITCDSIIEYTDGHRDMTITVKNQTANQYRFEVSNITTVYDLKKLYCERYFKAYNEDTVRNTCLIFDGKKLQNDDTLLVYYGITHGSIICEITRILIGPHYNITVSVE